MRLTFQVLDDGSSVCFTFQGEGSSLCFRFTMKVTLCFVLSCLVAAVQVTNGDGDGKDIFLKRFICLVDVHYHKVNLNSDKNILLSEFKLTL